MIGNVFEYLGNPSLGLYWLKGRVLATIHAKTSNFVSAFVDINVCPPPFFGKMFTKSTDKNRVGPPPPNSTRTTNTVHTQYKHSTNTVQTQYTHSIVQTQYTHSNHTVHTQYTHSTHTVQTQYKHTHIQ